MLTTSSNRRGKVFHSIWRFLGSVNLTIWLLVLIAFNLAVGSLYAHLYRGIIGQLDYMRFQEWISPDSLSAGWWVLSLLLMLFFLGVNMVACTTNRLFFLVKERRKYSSGALFLALSPSLMHVCFIVIMLGHVLTLFAFDATKVPAQTGASIRLPAGSVTMANQLCTHWEKPGLDGLVKQCSATLELRTFNQSIRKEVSILHPVFWEDYIIHLTLSEKAKSGEPPGLALLIKKEPGLKLMLWGGAFFCILITCYFIKIFKFRRGGTSSC